MSELLHLLGYGPCAPGAAEITKQNITMSSTGSTLTFTENDKFDGTNWTSWRRLIRLAANQRGAIGYLEGSI